MYSDNICLKDEIIKYEKRRCNEQGCRLKIGKNIEKTLIINIEEYYKKKI